MKTGVTDVLFKFHNKKKTEAERDSWFTPHSVLIRSWRRPVLVPLLSCRLGTNTDSTNHEWSPSQTVYRNKEKCCKVLPASQVPAGTTYQRALTYMGSFCSAAPRPPDIKIHQLVTSC